MLDGVNGSNPLSPTDQGQEKVTGNRPPTGTPYGAPAVEPDVSVAISELAQARVDALMSPASVDAQASMRMGTADGGIKFGLDRGGFEWPLDTASTGTAAQDASASMEAWEAAKDVVNGVYVADADASESAYIALGKSTVNASE